MIRTIVRMLCCRVPCCRVNVVKTCRRRLSTPLMKLVFVMARCCTNRNWGNVCRRRVIIGWVTRVNRKMLSNALFLARNRCRTIAYPRVALGLWRKRLVVGLVSRLRILRKFRLLSNLCVCIVWHVVLLRFRVPCAKFRMISRVSMARIL